MNKLMWISLEYMFCIISFLKCCFIVSLAFKILGFFISSSHWKVLEEFPVLIRNLSFYNWKNMFMFSAGMWHLCKKPHFYRFLILPSFVSWCTDWKVSRQSQVCLSHIHCILLPYILFSSMFMDTIIIHLSKATFTKTSYTFWRYQNPIFLSFSVAVLYRS